MHRQLAEAENRLVLQGARQAAAAAACEFVRATPQAGNGSLVDFKQSLECVERSTLEAEAQVTLHRDLRQSIENEPPDQSARDTFIARELARLQAARA